MRVKKTQEADSPHERHPSPYAVPRTNLKGAETGPIDLTREDIEMFCGPNAGVYAHKWIGEGVRGWNWSAFFAGIFWMLYRRMYLETVIWVAVILSWGALDSLFSPGLVVLSNIASVFMFPVVAAYLYHARARRKIRAARLSVSVEEQLRLSGGVSVPAVWIGVVVFVPLVCTGAMVMSGDLAGRLVSP